MDTRRVVGTLIASVALVLVACQPEQPPSGYVPPVIDSVAVSPQTVTAGSTIEITVRAHDDDGIPAVLHEGFALPQGVRLPWSSASCTDYDLQPDGANAIIASASCVVPAFATNGPWLALVHVDDVTSFGTTGNAPFTVVGGSDDVTGPTTESVQYSPGSTVPTTGTFTATARVSDPTGPVRLVSGCCPPAVFGGPFNQFTCTPATLVPVSSTAADVSTTCTGQASNTPAEYIGRIVVSDALGNPSDIQLAVTVT